MKNTLLEKMLQVFLTEDRKMVEQFFSDKEVLKIRKKFVEMDLNQLYE